MSRRLSNSLIYEPHRAVQQFRGFPGKLQNIDGMSSAGRRGGGAGIESSDRRGLLPPQAAKGLDCMWYLRLRSLRRTSCFV